MVLIKTRDKWDAAYDLLNLLLKEKNRYCNMCGANYVQGKVCCDAPQIGSHYEHLQAVVKQNKTKIASQDSATGTSEHGYMRSSIAMPPVLFNEWCETFARLYEVKLFADNTDLHKCMRKMPFLMTCSKV